MVVCGPYSGGQSFQRQPHRNTCRMPLMTRRSSARSLPRTSVGRCGSIRCHCSSSSQKRLDRIRCSHLTAENRQPILTATNLLGFDPRTNLATNRGLDDVVRAIKYWLMQLEHVGETLPKAWI